MKDSCCDFCGREKKKSELVPEGQAMICEVCKKEQKKGHVQGKISKGGMFKNSQYTK